MTQNTFHNAMFPNITDFYNLTFSSPNIKDNVTNLGDGTLQVDYYIAESGFYTFFINCTGTNGSVQSYPFIIYPGNESEYVHWDQLY